MTILVASLLLAGAGAGSARGPAARGPAASPNDVQRLFPRAVKRVRAGKPFRRAVFLIGEGQPAEGKRARAAADIRSWIFVFANRGRRFPSVTLEWRRGRGFGAPEGVPSPFFDAVKIKRAPRLSLAEGIERLRRAGHRAAFFNVTLRNPLGPETGNPLYIFTFATGYIAVDTVSGAVKPVS